MFKWDWTKKPPDPEDRRKFAATIRQWRAKLAEEPDPVERRRLRREMRVFWREGAQKLYAAEVQMRRIYHMMVTDFAIYKRTGRMPKRRAAQ
jgi:hypothetical protein